MKNPKEEYLFFSKDTDGDATMQTLGAHKATMFLAFETLLGRKFISVILADFFRNAHFDRSMEFRNHDQYLRSA